MAAERIAEFGKLLIASASQLGGSDYPTVQRSVIAERNEHV